MVTQPATAWEAARAVLRGLTAVLMLILTAVDQLVTAVIGVPPLERAVRRVRRAVSDEYRRAYYDAVDAEVVTDPAPDDPGGPQEGGA